MTLLTLRKVALAIIWYGSYLIIAIKMVGNTLQEARFDLIFFESLLVAVIVLAIFVFIHLSWKHLVWVSASVQSSPQEKESFPSPATKTVALWLIIITVVSLLGVFFGLWLHGKPPIAFQEFRFFASSTSIELVEAYIAMMAAAVGSCVTTILAYIRHASNKRDFRVSYVPWYLARPAMGVLLGLIFYFVIKGGLIVLVEPGEGGAKIESLNPWGVAGLGSLVGMFSKQAVEKLREVFNTMFQANS
ncbi:MAG: hypothetical protein ACRBHB_07065 [Arenicella sp.]